jgi:cysteine desulfurase / selenocysteine lyase
VTLHRVSGVGYDVGHLRRQFPILAQSVNGKPLAYLDNGASTQRPQAVLDAVSHYETHLHANVHRGVHTLSQLATDAFEGARERVRRFLNAAASREIIFTRATRLMASVVPRVKMISRVDAALRNRRTRSRAPSKASVAS